MNILIIDSSSKNLIVIVKTQDRYVVRKTFDDKKTEQIFPMIDELLRSINLDISDIDVFAAVVGPGSYTGIRVGVCAINSMAFAINKKLIAVNVLEVLAYGYKKENNNPKKFICLVDSKYDYYALEINEDKENYCILQYADLNNYEGEKVYIKEDYTNNLILKVEEKIKEQDFSDQLIPFYMKKSRADR